MVTLLLLWQVLTFCRNFYTKRMKDILFTKKARNSNLSILIVKRFIKYISVPSAFCIKLYPFNRNKYSKFSKWLFLTKSSCYQESLSDSSKLALRFTFFELCLLRRKIQCCIFELIKWTYLQVLENKDPILSSHLRIGGNPSEIRCICFIKDFFFKEFQIHTFLS